MRTSSRKNLRAEDVPWQHPSKLTTSRDSAEHRIINGLPWPILCATRKNIFRKSAAREASLFEIIQPVHN
jgi:hypothetical protein